MERIKILTLMDNLPSEQKALISEHGLSFYIETEEIRILFDFGSGRHTYENAVNLNVPLDTVDVAVGSHGHYDHSNGYRTFVENGLHCPLITGKGYFCEKYAFDGVKGTYLGNNFGLEFLEKHDISHKVCDGTRKLSDHCYVVGDFERTYEMEQIPTRFVLRDMKQWKPDRFEDEVCLVFEEANGLTLITGCSHPGILNMLATVSKRFQKKIKTVIGGTHLVEAGKERISSTISEMKSLGVELAGFNHCSGSKIRGELKEESGIQTFYLGTGDSIFL